MLNVITGTAGSVGDAVVDAIRRAVASLPGVSASFRVQPERVYELANSFDRIADRIEGGFRREIMNLKISPPGDDLPSRIATRHLVETGFGDAGLVTRLAEYAAELRRAATALRGTGQQYGLTDRTEGGRLNAAGP